MGDIIPLEEGGLPWAFHEPSQKPGEEPCHMVIYKDPQAIPDEVFQRVGMEKKKA